MSIKHPIIAVTGSSGAGTTTVKRSFEHIFRREKITSAVIEGDSMHKYDRAEMKKVVADAEARNEQAPTHFGPDANELAELESIFKNYGETGHGKRRFYLHNDEEAAPYGQQPGTFTPWENLPEHTDLLFYEGLHGAYVGDDADVAQHVDLAIGVVPVVNLEWIQKIHRDTAGRGYSVEAVTQTILRRMHDYVNYICPQFSRTHINFQRVPIVDTSNPFIARDIPTARRIDGRDPLPRSARRRLPLPADHDPRLLHVAAEHHRRPRRQDGTGHATGAVADHPGPHGKKVEAQL